MGKATTYVGKQESTSVSAVVNLRALAQQRAPSAATKTRSKPPVPSVLPPEPRPFPDDALIYDVPLARHVEPDRSLERFALSSPPRSTTFEALGQHGSRYPGDAHGAFTSVRNGLLVAVTNEDLRVQTTNGDILLTVGLDDFFSGLSTPDVLDVWDPKVIWHHASNTFVLVAVANPRTATSSLLVAVCPAAEPTGDWRLYRIPITNQDPAQILWLDFPCIGLDSGWVVVHCTVFNNNNVAVRGNIYTILSYELLHLGTTLHYGFVEAPDSTIPLVPLSIPQGATNYTYILVEYGSGEPDLGNGIRMHQLNSAPLSLTPSHVFRAPGLSWDTRAPTREFAPQRGTNRKIDTVDARIHNVFGGADSFVCAQTVYLPRGAATRSAIQVWVTGSRWREGSLIPASGCIRIDDAAGTYFYAFPTVATWYGKLLVAYSRFAANEYASAAFSLFELRGFSDTGELLYTTIVNDEIYKAGEAPYDLSATINRFGDYGSTVEAPGGFYSIQSYAAAQVSGHSRWGTWWLKVEV